MVKLKGPSISLQAAGSVGGALVFSNWKGRAYVKKLTKPTNPKSGSQVGGRTMMRFLSINWANLSAAEMATWLDLAVENNISNYNAFLAYNLERWGRYLPPTKAFPATEATEAMEIGWGFATAKIRSIELRVHRAESFDDWGIVIHRSTSTGFAPAIPNAIQAIYWPDAGDDDLYWTDTPLQPNTYYYRLWTFSGDGAFDRSYTNQWNATVT